MIMQTPKISVIIPVYNVESYLSKCIDSILCQTYTDFELLLVDDGSSDASGKICDMYKENCITAIVLKFLNLEDIILNAFKLTKGY